MKAIPEHTIAHYRILEPLGSGGMGAVHKAYDKKLQRVVAIKLLKPEYVSHQDRRRRFFQEARAASALNHPHILTVYDVGEDEDGTPYIAMEYVEGETLRQKISARSYQVKENLDIAIQIAEGLAKAHEAGTRKPNDQTGRLRKDSRLRSGETHRPTGTRIRSRQ